jgi:hypothetical protein
VGPAFAIFDCRISNFDSHGGTLPGFVCRTRDMPLFLSPGQKAAAKQSSLQFFQEKEDFWR